MVIEISYLHKCIPYDMTFILVPSFYLETMTLEFDLLRIFLTQTITFEWLVIEHSYFVCATFCKQTGITVLAKQEWDAGGEQKNLITGRLLSVFRIKAILQDLSRITSLPTGASVFQKYISCNKIECRAIMSRKTSIKIEAMLDNKLMF